MAETADKQGSRSVGYSGRIVLVTGDLAWRARVRALLVEHDYGVESCSRGEDAVTVVLGDRPDLVVVDLDLRDRYGPALCSLIRARSAVPIIARGGSARNDDVCLALRAGADSHVETHVGAAEFLARVRALLRRVRSTRPGQLPAVLEVDGVTLDRATHSVRVAGMAVDLGRRESEILELLMAASGRVVSRDELRDQLWGAAHEARHLDADIRRLRAKLEAADGIRRIEAVRGVGFRFRIVANVEVAVTSVAILEATPWP